MATGYLYKSQCYSTLADATAARWSDVVPGIVSGATAYITNVEWSGAQWQYKRYSINNSGVISLTSSTAVPVLAFPACNTAQNFTDGMLLGWGVVAAMAAAWGVKFLSRTLTR